jgi:hypothetical protein
LPPGRWICGIQLVYDNRFSSVFEYEDSFIEKKIDWRSVVGEACPVCGQTGCWREISPYDRTAIELFPFRKGKVSIARFQCRKTMRTFSLLPYQLAPYHQYTIESMIWALLLWYEIHEEAAGGASKAADELPADSSVTPWLLRHWLGVVALGLRSGHSVLRDWYELSGIHSGDRPDEMLREVYSYCLCFGSRGPPNRLSLRAAMRRLGSVAGRHLVGVPSQERRRLSAR